MHQSLLRPNTAPRPGSLTHGLTRTQDILVTLSGELGRLAPQANFRLRSRANYIAQEIASPRKATTEGMLDEADAVLDELCGKLSQIAQTHGMIFGTHEGSKTDYGFWMPDPDLGA